MTFADPASPSGINYGDLQGALLMFEVMGVEDHVPTAYTKAGEKNPAVRANLTVLDGTQQATVLEDCLVFPKVLQGQLRSRVGQLVLGRLGQGVAKAGQSAPWKLEPASDEDKRKAEEWMKVKAGPALSQPGNANNAAEAPF